MIRLSSQLIDEVESEKEVELEYNLYEIKELLSSHSDIINKINLRIPDKIQVGLYTVYCKEIKNM